MNDEHIRFIQTNKGLRAMTEWNTPIYYYVNEEINRRKTLKALAKFYSAYYAKLTVNNLKRNLHESISSKPSKAAH